MKPLLAFCVSFLLVISLSSSSTTTTTTNVHNITRVVDNASMSTLIAKALSLNNVLCLHVFVDYFGSKKLNQITKGSTSTTTMYQDTVEAPDNTDYDIGVKGGKVQCTPEDEPSKTNVVEVKSILEMSYNTSVTVLQINDVQNSPEPEALDPNLTSLLQRDGCKAFYTLLSTSEAIVTFFSIVDGGVTVFCPSDDAVAAFAPKFKKLTAEEKTSLLLYHGVPTYYNSMETLRSSNGLMNTLATDGANNYDFTVQNDGDHVTLKTKVVTAMITGTVVDEEPVAIYMINKVLLPRELFKAKGSVELNELALVPKATKKKNKASKKGGDVEAPGPDSSDDYDDSDAVDRMANSGGRLVASTIMAVLLLAVCSFIFVLGVE